MKKFILSLIFVGIFISNAQAGQYLMNETKYFPSIRESCDIKVYKDSTMTVGVVCSKGGGNCSGHTTSGNFSCNTFSGNRANVSGVNNAVNWILNNM